MVEKDTKSLAGERELPLPAPVLAALKSSKALQAKEKLALGEAYAESGYVLVHETGAAFTIKQLRRRAYRLMAILGLRRVRLYDARSSCLTFLANNGVPDHILARWAGHTSVTCPGVWPARSRWTRRPAAGCGPVAATGRGSQATARSPTRERHSLSTVWCSGCWSVRFLRASRCVMRILGDGTLRFAANRTTWKQCRRRKLCGAGTGRAREPGGRTVPTATRTRRRTRIWIPEGSGSAGRAAPRGSGATGFPGLCEIS
ncbi:hypothetical protein SUDANB51_06684 [Streptomyces sp. enrichment culture]